MARKKKPAEPNFVLYDVLYQDGTRSSNRRVASADVDPIDGDASVLALIEAKVAGKEVAVAPAAPAPAAVPDLMAALQASVEAVGRYNASWDGEEQPKPKRTRKQPDATSPRKRASTRPTTKKS